MTKLNQRHSLGVVRHFHHTRRLAAIGLLVLMTACSNAPAPGDGAAPPAPSPPATPVTPATQVSIAGESWLINGRVTYPGSPAQGLLLNARMVNATFDDANPATVGNWVYPDGTRYDPERQTAEFIAALPTYASYGLRAVTLNLQGGGPKAGAFTGEQPWDNSAYNADGSLKTVYLERLGRVIRASDENGIVVILGLFYFGQDERLSDEVAVKNAVDNATDWLVGEGYTNVLIEICNEAGPDYTHPILRERVDELIVRVQRRSEGKLLVSTSFRGGVIPSDAVLRGSDFVLLHGNNQDANNIREMVQTVRGKLDTPKPIVFNEDSTSLANLEAAVSAGASWGYYDQGRNNYQDGFQSPPTDWSVNTPAKKAFFERVAALTQ